MTVDYVSARLSVDGVSLAERQQLRDKYPLSLGRHALLLRTVVINVM